MKNKKNRDSNDFIDFRCSNPAEVIGPCASFKAGKGILQLAMRLNKLNNQIKYRVCSQSFRILVEPEKTGADKTARFCAFMSELNLMEIMRYRLKISAFELTDDLSPLDLILINENGEQFSFKEMMDKAPSISRGAMLKVNGKAEYVEFPVGISSLEDRMRAIYDKVCGEFVSGMGIVIAFTNAALVDDNTLLYITRGGKNNFFGYELRQTAAFPGMDERMEEEWYRNANNPDYENACLEFTKYVFENYDLLPNFDCVIL